MTNMEIIKSEIEAMYKYSKRDTFNVVVIYEMCKQLQITIKGSLKSKLAKQLEDK